MKARFARPDGRPLELQGRNLRSALVRLHCYPSVYADHLLLCVEDSAPALVARAAFVAYVAQTDVSLAEQLEAPVPAGCLRTLRLDAAPSRWGPPGCGGDAPCARRRARRDEGS